MSLLPWEYAVRNMGRSKSRLALIVGGSGLVVLLMLIAIGFVKGMRTSLGDTGEPDNVMLVLTGSEESVERSEIVSGVETQLLGSVDGFKHTFGVPHVSPEIHVQIGMQFDADAPAIPASLRGVTPTAFLVHPRVRIVQGQPPRPGHNELMVGRLAGTRMGLSADQLAIGRTLYLDGRPWTVSGIFEAGGTVMDSEIWLPLYDLLTATRRETISTVIASLDTATFGDVDQFARQRIDLELAAMMEQDYYSGLSRFYRPIQGVALLTAALIALTGLCGGLNALYAAFASRVRELGALQAIGFSRRAILVSLVQESALACSMGSLIATAIGAFLLDGVSVRFSLGAFGLMIDASVIGAGLLIGLGLGVIGALPPAYRCLKLPISTALKAS